MDIRVKIKHTQRKKLLLLPISFWPRQMSVFSLKFLLISFIFLKIMVILQNYDVFTPTLHISKVAV